MAPAVEGIIGGGLNQVSARSLTILVGYGPAPFGIQPTHVGVTTNSMFLINQLDCYTVEYPQYLAYNYALLPLTATVQIQTNCSTDKI